MTDKPIKLAINGAAGRMGQRLISLAGEDKAFEVVCAIEDSAHPYIGKKLGGVTYADRLSRGADVVIDFSLPKGTEAVLAAAVNDETAMVIGTTGLGQADEKMIRQALDIEREYGGVSISTLDSLGWVQYKLGDSHMGQAGRTFQEVIAGSRRKAAADGSDEHAVLYDHAGDVYYRLRRRDDAIDMWRQALRLARGAELDQDTERIRREAPAKLAAVASGRVPPVAPLGEGVPDDLMRLDEDERIDREAAD